MKKQTKCLVCAKQKIDTEYTKNIFKRPKTTHTTIL